MCRALIKLSLIHIFSYQYKAGQFTDDTSQALTILDSLIETDFVPDSQSIATHILKWAEKENAFENNILGPTSKAVSYTHLDSL